MDVETGESKKSLKEFEKNFAERVGRGCSLGRKRGVDLFLINDEPMFSSLVEDSI